MEEGLILCDIVYKPHYTNAVEVRLYDTAEHMFNAAEKWNKKRKDPYFLTNDYEAITLENSNNEFKKIGNVEYRVFSTIFLHKEKLSYSILLHEFGHATFILFRNIYRFDCKFEKISGTGDDEEEIFCYNQEAFFKHFLTILKKKKIEIQQI
jgi:hypothetical protein